jgi:hypothetical protein
VNLSAPFIERPVAITLLTLAIAFAGFFAYFKPPVAPLPQVAYTTIWVSRRCRGEPRDNGGHSRDRPGQSPALPLARVAAAVKAGDNMDSPVHDPKEQRIWKTPAACAADISIDHRELAGAVANRSMTVSISAVNRAVSSAPRTLYQSRASISLARAAALKTTGATISAARAARP